MLSVPWSLKTVAGSSFRRDQLQRIVAWQLKRSPSIGFTVAVQCKYGWPAVLKNSTRTSSGQFNPNLYYLSCPYLIAQLSRLEDAGFIRRLQEQVGQEPTLADDLAGAQALHAREWHVAADLEEEAVALADVNIAAAGDPAHLKCLHAHLAFFLVHSDYRVGRLIAGEVGAIWCPDERCAGWEG